MSLKAAILVSNVNYNEVVVYWKSTTNISDDLQYKPLVGFRNLCKSLVDLIIVTISNRFDH